MRSIKFLFAWTVSFIFILMTLNCGGGGNGGDNGNGTKIRGPKFNAGASFGDLLVYTLDTTNLLYSYTIIESSFGLNGQSNSGNLILNNDGTYSPSSDPSSRIVLVKNKNDANTFLVGQGEVQGSPMYFAGVPKITTDYEASEIAGKYNYISFECPETLQNNECPSEYKAYYGTFEIFADGTWKSCSEGGDIDNCLPDDFLSGTWSDSGNGIISVEVSGLEIGSGMLVPSAGGGKIIVIDLKNRPPLNSGPGFLIGVKYTDLSGTDLSGVYKYVSTEGYYGTATIPDPNNSGDTYQIIDTDPQGGTTTITGNLTRNSPWNGWLEGIDSNNTTNYILLLPDDGVFLYFDPNDNTWIGMGGTP